MTRRQALTLAGALAGAAALATAFVACEAVPLTAAPGSTIFLQANPGFVAANGDRALVTAMLTEPAGTFVPDGTNVFFFTDLGSIPESAQTVNGVARVWFVSDSRSGSATITAYSGGPAPQPNPTASPGGGGGGGGNAATGTGTASITIAVGNSRPSRVFVSANPQLLAGNRQTTIVANVFDANGNPVQNVPVFFGVSGAPLQEFLASGGSPQYTNSNGQAFDLLTTRAPNGVDQKTVTVTASTPAEGVEGSVEVTVNYDAGF